MSWFFSKLVGGLAGGLVGLPVFVAGKIITTVASAGKERNSFIDNVIRDKATPVPGSIVCCDLSPLPLGIVGLPTFDHSGVYIRDNWIIHRDGDGYLAGVTPSEFLERLGGINAAISVYVSCNGDKAVGSDAAALRALNALADGRHDGYSLTSQNCHHFSHYCITGNMTNGLINSTFTSLESTLETYYGMDNWRVWDLPA